MSESETVRQPFRIGFVGWGAIATRVASLLAERGVESVEIAAIATHAGHGDLLLPAGAVCVETPFGLEGLGLDMVIECAGRPAVAEWGEAALRHAKSFVVSSTSAFCDEALLTRLTEVARAAGSRLIVPSGALGDLGALAAASALPLDAVTHAIVKPPRAWKGTKAEEAVDLDTIAGRTEFFTGSAREAATLYPQNANVAAITALYGIGMDKTRVVLVADPAATRNGHQVTAEGAFGRLVLKLENEPLKTNPKSSEMTALSIARLIENQVSPLVR